MVFWGPMVSCSGPCFSLQSFEAGTPESRRGHVRQELRWKSGTRNTNAKDHGTLCIQMRTRTSCLSHQGRICMHFRHCNRDPVYFEVCHCRISDIRLRCTLFCTLRKLAAPRGSWENDGFLLWSGIARSKTRRIHHAMFQASASKSLAASGDVLVFAVPSFGLVPSGLGWGSLPT